MPLLSDEDREAIKGHFALMTEDVTVTLTKAPGECETESILTELCALSPRLTMDIVESKKESAMLPSLSIGNTGRLIFRGIPSGYEFSSLLTGIIDSGRTEQTLSDETMAFLDGLKEDLHIKVFVTPTCPYCPNSVVLAHRMAAYSDRVVAEGIEANEFQDLSIKYKVQGVPRTVINETYAVEGAQPESYLIEGLKNHMKTEK
ncbi:MAG: thioredoxin family protein [Candidatus Fermentibacteria bacterium]|nr:thioredoxin family protein [Candidatus Fermentibacteria bacterium]